jgi:hypothetical protein
MTPTAARVSNRHEFLECLPVGIEPSNPLTKLAPPFTFTDAFRPLE